MAISKEKLMKNLNNIQEVYKKEIMVCLVIDDLKEDIEQGEFNL